MTYQQGEDELTALRAQVKALTRERDFLKNANAHLTTDREIVLDGKRRAEGERDEALRGHESDCSRQVALSPRGEGKTVHSCVRCIHRDTVSMLDLTPDGTVETGCRLGLSRTLGSACERWEAGEPRGEGTTEAGAPQDTEGDEPGDPPCESCGQPTVNGYWTDDDVLLCKTCWKGLTDDSRHSRGVHDSLRPRLDGGCGAVSGDHPWHPSSHRVRTALAVRGREVGR